MPNLGGNVGIFCFATAGVSYRYYVLSARPQVTRKRSRLPVNVVDKCYDGVRPGAARCFAGASAIKATPMTTRIATPTSSPREIIFRNACVPITSISDSNEYQGQDNKEERSGDKTRPLKMPNLRGGFHIQLSKKRGDQGKHSGDPLWDRRGCMVLTRAQDEFTATKQIITANRAGLYIDQNG